MSYLLITARNGRCEQPPCVGDDATSGRRIFRAPRRLIDPRSLGLIEHAREKWSRIRFQMIAIVRAFRALFGVPAPLSASDPIPDLQVGHSLPKSGARVLEPRRG
jgi:hypothetical protein